MLIQFHFCCLKVYNNISTYILQLACQNSKAIMVCVAIQTTLESYHIILISALCCCALLVTINFFFSLCFHTVSINLSLFMSMSNLVWINVNIINMKIHMLIFLFIHICIILLMINFKELVYGWFFWNLSYGHL
jgi:hypothetical protein